jgi:hypothetical protein
MRQLFVPLTGPMGRLAGSGYNAVGESLDRPTWQGAELSDLDAFPDVWGAVSEAEFHDWIIGVRHPLFRANGPGPIRFFDPDPRIREQALGLAASAAQQAHHLGARFIILPFPAAALDLGAWNESTLRAEALHVAAFLDQLQRQEQIRIALMPEGPNPFFDEGDLLTELLTAYPDLSLCLDTGRIGLLARQHGRDPLELTQRWLPWTRYLRLHGARWTPDGRYLDRLPVTGAETADRWPEEVPAVAIAQLVLTAQPNLTVILDWDPSHVNTAQLEAAHAFVTALCRQPQPKRRDLA